MIIKFTEHSRWQCALFIAKAHGLLGDIMVGQEWLWVRGRLAAAMQALGY